MRKQNSKKTSFGGYFSKLKSIGVPFGDISYLHGVVYSMCMCVAYAAVGVFRVHVCMCVGKCPDLCPLRGG